MQQLQIHYGHLNRLRLRSNELMKLVVQFQLHYQNLLEMSYQLHLHLHLKHR